MIGATHSSVCAVKSPAYQYLMDPQHSVIHSITNLVHTFERIQWNKNEGKGPNSSPAYQRCFGHRVEQRARPHLIHISAASDVGPLLKLHQKGVPSLRNLVHDILHCCLLRRLVPPAGLHN